MKNIIKAFWCSVVLVGLISAASVHATPITITIDTSSLNGTGSDLAFDLIDGGLPANTVTISGFASDGSLGATSSTGDVTGTLPGVVTLGDTTFFNEYLQNITLGNSLTFIFDTSENAADPTSFPDAFSFFLLDPSTSLPLFATSDPTGANALFLFNIGATSPLEVYTLNAVTVRAQLPNVVPTPGTLSLLVGGLLALGVMLLTRKYRLQQQLNECNSRCLHIPPAPIGVNIFALMVLAISLLGAVPAFAVVADVTTSFAMTKTGFVLNRQTNTYDTAITLKNTSPFTVSAPIQLVVTGLPSGVLLANKSGITTTGASFFNVSVPNGAIVPNVVIQQVVLKFSNPARVALVPIIKVSGDIPEAAVGLPPDPGYAGQTTVGGIDSNGNGVRDDIERWIAINYQSSSKLRAALVQEARALQGILLAGSKQDPSPEVAREAAQKSSLCLRFVAPGYERIGIAREIESEFLNTQARTAALLQYDRFFAGQTLVVRANATKADCVGFDPDSLGS